jgi:hypothetical protein
MHSTFQLQVGRQGAWERHHLVFAELPAAETSRELFRIMKTTIVRVTLLGWNLRSQAGAWERGKKAGAWERGKKSAIGFERIGIAA